MRTLEEIVNLINSNSQAIINNIAPESIAVYKFLQLQFATTDVTQNPVFQFVYRSFYRLDNAGLTNEFKTAYFQILQEYRYLKSFDFPAILERLSEIENRKGQKTLQFSFITKMQSTIFTHGPIYDSEVVRVFGFVRPNYKLTFEQKKECYQEQLQIIGETYNVLSKDRQIIGVVEKFDEEFKEHNLPNSKIFDFIFWSAGKLIRDEKKIEKPQKSLV